MGGASWVGEQWANINGEVSITSQKSTTNANNPTITPLPIHQHQYNTTFNLCTTTPTTFPTSYGPIPHFFLHCWCWRSWIRYSSLEKFRTPAGSLWGGVGGDQWKAWNWSCDTRANERPQKKCTWWRTQTHRQTWQKNAPGGAHKHTDGHGDSMAELAQWCWFSENSLSGHKRHFKINISIIVPSLLPVLGNPNRCWLWKTITQTKSQFSIWKVVHICISIQKLKGEFQFIVSNRVEFSEYKKGKAQASLSLKVGLDCKILKQIKKYF